MTLAYYPGCSLHGTSREFDESVRAVAARLGIALHEIEDWSCCGASATHGKNPLLGVALPARNLALAEAQGHDEVLAPCAACFSRLAEAHHQIAEDEALAETVGELLERPFGNVVEVTNIVQFLLEHAEQIQEGVSASPQVEGIGELKVASYYGCLLVRPVDVAGADDTEVPTTMEQVAAACGATPVKWNMAVECCGGSFSMSRTSSVLRLGRAIIDDAHKAGADAIVVACPMCHANLDFRQAAMARDGGDAVPVLYLTQLVGLALGIDAEELGLQRHFVDPRPLIASLPGRASARAGAEAAARGARRAAREAGVA